MESLSPPQVTKNFVSDDNGEKSCNVSDAVAQEYLYYHKLLSESLQTPDKDQESERIRYSCCDDPRNAVEVAAAAAAATTTSNGLQKNGQRRRQQLSSVVACKHCQRTGDDTSGSQLIGELIDTAAFIGLFLSMGTLVESSQLSTNCSRLQKQGRSVASLTYESHVDVLHTTLDKNAVLFAQSHANAQETPSSTADGNDDDTDETDQCTGIRNVHADNDQHTEASDPDDA